MSVATVDDVVLGRDERHDVIPDHEVNEGEVNDEDETFNHESEGEIHSERHVQSQQSNFESDGIEDRDGIEDSDGMEEIEEPEEIETYKSILKSLSKEWMDNEVHHDVSQAASDSFFEIAKKWFFKLICAKQREGLAVKTPGFPHIRRKMYEEKVPKISLKIAYMHKETQVITVKDDLESTPTSQFPPSQYQKLFEIASVKVKIQLYNYCRSFLLNQFSSLFSFIFGYFSAANNNS